MKKILIKVGFLAMLISVCFFSTVCFALKVGDSEKAVCSYCQKETIFKCVAIGGDVSWKCQSCNTPFISVEFCTKSDCAGYFKPKLYATTDGTKHYRVCSKNKNHQGYFSKHSYDFSMICVDCRYFKHTHMYKGISGDSQCVLCAEYTEKKLNEKGSCGHQLVYKYNAHKHWKKCNACNKVIGEGIFHTYNGESVCTICGAMSTASVDNAPVKTCKTCKRKMHYRFHDKSHWLHCDNCGHIDNSGEGHDFKVEGNQKICKKCTFVKVTDGKPVVTPSEGSGSDDKCSQCNAQVNRGWLNDGKGNHYNACKNGHHNNVTQHSDLNSNAECDICDAPMVCYKCKKALITGWLDNGAGSHYKECVGTEKHQSYIAGHFDNDKNGSCDLCMKNLNSKPAQKTGTLFNDLPDDHWGYSEVKAMVDAGIVNGRGDGTLGTNDAITAEEFMALLSRVVNKKKLKQSSGTVYLQDKITGWSKDGYISLLKVVQYKSNENSNSDKKTVLGKEEVQLILGNTDEECIENYKKPLQREKVASLLGLFVEDGKENTNNVILKAKDWSNISSIFRSRINELAEKNIFRGAKEPDGIYVYPKQDVTRVEAIALINRLYNSI